MTPGLGIKPGTHWWKANALTTAPTLLKVADSKGHMILGRKQVLVMEYISFPEIQEPPVQAKTERSIKTFMREPAKTIDGPAIPRVQKCTDPVVPVIQKFTQERITIMERHTSCPQVRITYCRNVLMCFKA